MKLNKYCTMSVNQPLSIYLSLEDAQLVWWLYIPRGFFINFFLGCSFFLRFHARKREKNSMKKRENTWKWFGRRDGKCAKRTNEKKMHYLSHHNENTVCMFAETNAQKTNHTNKTNGNGKKVADAERDLMFSNSIYRKQAAAVSDFMWFLVNPFIRAIFGRYSILVLLFLLVLGLFLLYECIPVEFNAIWL